MPYSLFLKNEGSSYEPMKKYIVEILLSFSYANKYSSFQKNSKLLKTSSYYFHIRVFQFFAKLFAMPPKKVFLGQEDYLARNVHDDLLKLLPKSTNETVKVKKLISLNPRLKIVDGLFDKGNWVRDAKTSQIGLSLFKKWFLERKLFAPHAYIQNFDLGKLVVPNVFMDVDLLMTITKSYDPTIKVVRRIDGECLITISPKEIREVFGLGPLSDYHIPIDLKGLEKEYLSRRDMIRQGALRAHIGTIGNFPVIIASSRELFEKEYFTSQAIEIYMTLCRVFGEVEQNIMSISFMYMLAQIYSFGVDVIFYFSPYLTEEIHTWLVGIAKGKIEKTFGHYSLLIHVFLFKGATYFDKEMDLNREHEGEALPIQLQSADMTWDAKNASFIKFDMYFASY